MAGGRPNGVLQDWDPGPPWRSFPLVFTVALSWATQRPLNPFVSSSFLAFSNIHLLSGGTFIVGGGHHVLDITSHSTPGPESFTSATLPDFVDAIPISVYVSAGGVSIESREISVMFKDLVPPAGHDDSATSLAFSLGLPRHCGISSRCGSDRHLCSASAAVSPHPYGSLGLCKIYLKVFTHSGAIPELDQCIDTVDTPRGCWHLRGAASVSIESRGRSAMLKDSAPPAGHADGSASSAPSFGLPHQTPPLSLVLDHGMGIQMGR